MVLVKENKYKILSYNEEQLVDMEFVATHYLTDSDILLLDDNRNIYYFNYS